MQKFIEYLKNVRVEMGKVAWPSQEEVKSATILVVVFSLFFSVVVWSFDMALDRVIGFLLGM